MASWLKPLHSDPEVLRRKLLDLHRTLVDSEREAHERAHGRVTDRAFLDLLIKDPAFSWLGALTAIMVRLDELVEDQSPRHDELKGCIAEVRALLAPKPDGTPFQRKYAEIMQRSPAVVVAHGAVISALKKLQPKP
jgi:hypothetical protein